MRDIGNWYPIPFPSATCLVVMNWPRYKWNLAVFSVTVKSCFQSLTSCSPITGHRREISQPASHGQPTHQTWIVKTHSQLLKSTILSNLKLQSPIKVRISPCGPEFVLGNRSAGNSFFCPFLTPPGLGAGDGGGGVVKERA
jgi:hypothetical protein